MSTEQPRPQIRSTRFWVLTISALILIALMAGGALVAKTLADRAFAARDALQSAVPLASAAKDQILAGDATAAQQTVAQLQELTGVARAQADGELWRFAEGLPVVGPNLVVVRDVAATINDLVVRAALPASQMNLDGLAPAGGRIDTAMLTQASELVDQAATAVADARATIDGIDRSSIVDQVASGVDQLDRVVAQIEPLIAPAQQALAVLPGMLGAEGPRNYLVLVQNNAESRGTGGNPAALVMLHVDNGDISIAQQASSQDFVNGRPNPVAELDPATVALYGDKVGRYMQDVTMTPDFAESARIMGAFWAERFGTPIDGTVSIDPVALSYLMAATGPVSLPNGDALESNTVVANLLNEVYSRFPDPRMQDAYFAVAAGAIFDALTSVSNPRQLIEQATRAIDEGRLLYVPTSPAEAELIAGTRLTGALPTDNSETTLIGSYVNDITEGKLNYYMDTAVTVATDACTVAADVAPTFTVTSSLTSTLQPDQVRGLARYISPGRFFPKGVISTDLVLYGPVGATFVSASVDGVPVAAAPVEHLGRPAVKINVINDPASTHAVTAVFSGTAGADYGPVDVWHTPMVRETPVTIEAPGCAAQ
ncbi:DUF4012 domain-containing protein [Microbacterium sp. zg.Y625]|uniref:DUF4012 domain-containing protein n=1 Tax=Microbacterium jiangjiandongii TaxID=3049071 RepID=UPI00214B79EC|nr:MULTISPECIES: DUF4012 domain-containing protein [unclassified Microbacterium]MCR2793529.1 DUF4012 domain-containing protein [Microbacterium sp. zg.Y625]WIM25883.1 DUF4012 domain-containing protein [Microbacterium sp. zg-Y625]